MLDRFIQLNFTGPTEKEKLNLEEFHLKELICDGEWPYPLIKEPDLLVKAKNTTDEIQRLQALWIHQRLLENPVPTLKDEIYAMIMKVKEPTLLLMGVHIFQFYHDEERSEEFLNRVAEMCGFQYALKGVLGKRTKFQDFEVSQLVVETESSFQSTGSNGGCVENITLNDDVLLESIKLREEVVEKELSPIENAILLGRATHLLTFHAKDAVIVEKALAYVQRVLARPTDWSVYSTGLYLRSKLESEKTRMIERSTLQIQALADQVAVGEPSYEERSRYFFATGMPTPWELDRAQGFMFAKLGAFKTALEIFERRELWDEVIACQMQLGLNAKAEELLRRELDKNPSNPKLWCTLGDLLQEPQHWLHAWTISGNRFSRAQRSLGVWHFRREEWREAIRCFEDSLAINGLFEKTWFLLGCAAMRIEDYEKATISFRKVISIDRDSSDAWNNLAAVHLHLGKREDALRALVQATRLCFENWKVWDNLFRVALSLLEISHLLSAYDRLVDLSSDSDLLIDYFTKIILVMTSQDLLTESVKFNLRQTVQLIESKMSLLPIFINNPKFWHLTSQFYNYTKEYELEIESLFKEYRCISNAHFSSSNIPHQIFDQLDEIVSICDKIIKDRQLTKYNQQLQSIKECIDKRRNL